MMENLRIQILIQRFYPVVGGMERQCQAVVSNLISQGWDIKIWTYKPSLELPTHTNIDNIPIRRFGRGTQTHLDIFLTLFHLLSMLLRTRHQYDIIHIYGAGHLAMTGLLAGKLTGKPVVIRPATYSDVTRYLQGRQSETPTILGRIVHADPLKIKQRLFKQVAFWVALTEEIKAELEALPLPPQPIVRITNGVDTDYYKPILQEEKVSLRQQHKIPLDAIVYLFIGRFVPRKGLNELLQAWAQFSPSNPNAHLLLIGSGKGQNDSIEEEITQKATGLASVSYLGLTQNPLSYYQLSDVLTFPSHREGMPNVLLEGMACGLAPIVTRIGGVTDIVTNGQDSIMIAPQNVEELTEAMLEFAENKDKRQAMAQAARQKIIEQYSLTKVVQQYAELYKRAGKSRD